MANSTNEAPMANNINDAPQDEVSPELDAMVCDLLDGFLNALADGEELGVVLIAEDAHANRYQACFTEDGAEECLEGARHFVETNASGIQSDRVGALDRYAIAYLGGVELDCEFQDAIIVSFYQRGMSCGYSAYVLYTGAGLGENFMWSDPEPAGEEPALI